MKLYFLPRQLAYPTPNFYRGGQKCKICII